MYLRCTDDRRYEIPKFPLDHPTIALSLSSLMAKVKKLKSWAEQLADLDNPAPKGWCVPALLTRANTLQSLIQKMIPDNSRKRMAPSQLAMTRA